MSDDDLEALDAELDVEPIILITPDGEVEDPTGRLDSDALLGRVVKGLIGLIAADMAEWLMAFQQDDEDE